MWRGAPDDSRRKGGKGPMKRIRNGCLRRKPGPRGQADSRRLGRHGDLRVFLNSHSNVFFPSRLKNVGPGQNLECGPHDSESLAPAVIPPLRIGCVSSDHAFFLPRSLSVFLLRSLAQPANSACCAFLSTIAITPGSNRFHTCQFGTHASVTIRIPLD